MRRACSSTEFSGFPRKRPARACQIEFKFFQLTQFQWRPSTDLDTEIKVTPEIAAEHGLTREEYARIQKILGRDPSITELGIFSVMWSEHCSYKSSQVHLNACPREGS